MGRPSPATATTTPTGLTVNLTYNGLANAPTNAGSYTVIGTINDANYQGSATNTLVISPATGAMTLGSLSQTYNGTAKAGDGDDDPERVDGDLTYNGSANAPTNAGSYTVIGTINDANYQGSATNTLVISQATGVVTLGNLSQTYNGTAKAGDGDDDPERVDGEFDLQRFGQCPTNAGSYTVIGTINDANYQGSATNTLVISPATGAVTLGSLSQTYNGTAKAATATTTPSGLAVSLTYNGSATCSDQRRQLHGDWHDQRRQLPGQRDQHAGDQPGHGRGYAGQPEPDLQRHGQSRDGDDDPERVGGNFHLQWFGHSLRRTPAATR